MQGQLFTWRRTADRQKCLCISLGLVFSVLSSIYKMNWVERLSFWRCSRVVSSVSKLFCLLARIQESRRWFGSARSRLTSFPLPHGFFFESGRTVLHEAADGQEPEILQLVLAATPADVNEQDSTGTTPLIAAAQNDCAKCLRQLLDSGADPSIRDKQRRLAIHWAAQKCSLKALRVLLDACSVSDINAQDRAGLSPLHCALNSYIRVWSLIERQAVVELLLDRGADLRVKNRVSHLLARQPLTVRVRNSGLILSSAFKRMNNTWRTSERVPSLLFAPLLILSIHGSTQLSRTMPSIYSSYRVQMQP
eukprot:m.375895 g.375895  ORF g.375895 m.375895 type:complete len:307 (-) comp56183_c0_seq24:162-1082(-)